MNKDNVYPHKTTQKRLSFANHENTSGNSEKVRNAAVEPSNTLKISSPSHNEEDVGVSVMFQPSRRRTDVRFPFIEDATEQHNSKENGNKCHLKIKQEYSIKRETVLLVVVREISTEEDPWKVLVERDQRTGRLRPPTREGSAQQSSESVVVSLITQAYGGYKSMLRQVCQGAAGSKNRTPLIINRRNEEREPVESSVWGIRLTPYQAEHLPLKGVTTNKVITLTGRPNYKYWMPLAKLLAAMAKDPYEGGIWRACKQWFERMADPSEPKMRDYTYLHTHQDDGSTKLISEVSLSRATIPDSLIPQVVAAAGKLPGGVYDVRRLQQVLNHARSRAAENGAEVVCARDIIYAAQEMEWELAHGHARPTPPSFPPQHYGRQRQVLSQLAEVITQEADRGMPKPWVLVACECSGLVARHFKLAGCEVATCDLKDTEDNEIPHFKGDARTVVNLGFDLVISHPPCTHLSNASVFWLAKDPDRWASMHSAVRLFRDLYNADAPFVVVEQPVIHRYARQQLEGLRPTQMIQPHEHGHGETKNTALYIKGNLPEVRPTCQVLGRECRLSHLQAGPERGAIRSRFYIGVGAAMAMSWVPTLIDYCRGRVGAKKRPDLSCICESYNAERQLHPNGPNSSPTEGGSVARLAEPRRPFAAQFVAVARPAAVGASTVWVVCPHGAVLLNGDEQALGSLSEDADLPRCKKEECVKEAHEWKNGQDLALAYRERRKCINEIRGDGNAVKPKFKHHKSMDEKDGRMFPIKRVRKRGTGWYAWAPSASRFESAGDYRWLRLSRDGQAAIDNEIDKLRQLRVSNEGCYSSQSSADLRPKLPTIWANDSIGFKNKVYTESHGPIAHSEWKRLRRVQDELGSKCSACGARRDAAGVRSCRCKGDSPALGSDQAANRQSPKGNRVRNDKMVFVAGGVMELDRPEKKREMRTAAAVCETPYQIHERTLKRYYPVDRIEEGGALLRPAMTHGVAACVKSKNTSAPSKQCNYREKIGEMVTHASAFGIASTPKGLGAAHCAYISDLIVVDRRELIEPEGFRVASWVRYSLSDTGAGPSIIASALLNELPDKVTDRFEPVPSHVAGDVAGADGNLLVILGTVVLTFHLGGRLFEHKFQVVEGGQLLILGNDFLASHRGAVHPRLSMDTEPGYMSIDHEPSGERVHSLLRATPSSIMMPLDGISGRPPRQHPGVALEEGGGSSKESTFSQPAYPENCSGQFATAAEQTDKHEIHGETNTLDYATCAAITTPPLTKSDTEKLSKDSAKEVDQEVDEQENIREGDLADLSIQRSCSTSEDPLENELVKTHLVTREHLLVTSCPLSIPAWTERIIQVRLPKLFIGHEGPLLILPLPERKGLHKPQICVAASISRSDGEFISLTILNATKTQAHVGTLAALATIEAEVQVLTKPDSPKGSQRWVDLTNAQRAILNQCVLDPAKLLSDDQLARTRDLLAKHLAVFAPNPKCPGRTHLMEVNLELKPGVKPHRHAPSRLGEVGNKIAQELVDEMEANGVVRRSNSPWASRLVIVKKKDGSPRCCIDLRDTNSKLLICDTPLPRCDDAISKLAGTPNFGGEQPPPRAFRLYHTLDLASGFHCLPIREEHKERLAFVTQRGKWEFNVLPFGLASGPSCMQTLIDASLQGLAWEICVPYLDDVAIYAAESTFDKTFDLALERLDLVLERLGWAGLTAKAKKCTICAPKVEYLGHVISQDGVSPDPKKIEGMSKIPTESICTLETVRSFLGLTGYYRSFIKDYHLISGPLTQLTKKNVDVKTAAKTPEVIEAVNKLKEAMMCAPVLAAPRNDRQFIIHTDAATGHGIGGILLQRDDADDGEHDEGPERPIGYYGRRCNDAEKNYSVTECELLAVVETVKHFRPYLWGRHFTLVTDHAALKWLATMKDQVCGGASSRLTRWSLRLQEYRFDVTHKPGIAHKDADGISRLVGCVVPVTRVVPGSPSTETTVVQLFNKTIEDPKFVEELAELPERNLKDVHESLEKLRKSNEVRSSPYERSTKLGTTGTMSQYMAPVGSLLGRAMKATHDLSQVVVHGTQHLNPWVVAALPAVAREAAVNAHEAISQLHVNSDVPRAETLRREQLLDEDCSAMSTYLIGGITLSSPSRETWLKRIAPHCHLEDGLLRHQAEIGGTNPSRIWIPKACRNLVLSAFHEKMGHQGKDRTYGLLQRSVFWPGMSTDVTTHIEECHECAYAKRRPRKAGATQVPEVGQYPFELMITDILSMRKSHDGFTKVLIFADSLTRWIEAIPFRHDPSSSEIVSVFMTHIVCRHGVPRCIRSDCGSNLTSKLCREVYRLCGVDLAQSTAYHHATAGIVERFNHTLVEMTKASNPKGKDWASHLPFLCFAYNATPHRVTKESPACLIYGRDLRLPANMDLHQAAPKREEGALTVYAQELYSRLRMAWDLALRATHIAQRSDAERVDVSRDLSTSYEVNDRVLVKVGESKSTQNKLEYKWLGPFRVAEVLERNCYRLRDLHSRRVIDRVATDRLRPYLTITDLEPLAPDEYIIKGIIDHRCTKEGRQYKVHYRGFQKKDAEWNTEANLMVRCADLVMQYDRSLPANAWGNVTHLMDDQRKPGSEGLKKTTLPSGVPPAPPILLPVDVCKTPTSSTFPRNADEARFEKGLWHFRTQFQTTRGKKPRWLPAVHFSNEELLRLQPLQDQYRLANPKLAKLVAACEMRVSTPVVSKVPDLGIQEGGGTASDSCDTIPGSHRRKERRNHANAAFRNPSTDKLQRLTK